MEGLGRIAVLDKNEREIQGDGVWAGVDTVALRAFDSIDGQSSTTGGEPGTNMLRQKDKHKQLIQIGRAHV